jgi:hypothetical protein
MLFHREHRKEMMQVGWKRVGKIFIFAVILDVAYQIKVNHWIYTGETLIVALDGASKASRFPLVGEAPTPGSRALAMSIL